MKFDLEKYKRLFLTESREHLENISKILEKTKEALSEDEINTLFREAHSLKGMSAAMGYQGIADLSHGMENLMHEVRSGHLSFDESVREKLIGASDVLWRSVENIELDRPVEDMSEHIAKLKPLGQPVVSAPQQATAGRRPETAPAVPGAVTISVTFRDDVPSLFARAFLVFKNIEGFGRIIASTPHIDDIKKGSMTGRLVIEMEPVKPLEALRGYLSKVNEIREVEFKTAVRQAVARKDDSHEKEEDTRDQRHDEKLVLPQSVKVDINFLDNFVNITGELLTIKARIRETTKDLENIEVSNALNQMEILLKDMQEKIMRLRLTPLDMVFSRVPRWVRDLSQKLGKKVDVSVEGESIELDRSVVDAMFDPMLHTIRNCIDHGIESPTERKNAGKDPKGKVQVRAAKEREHVIVTIEDDGKGIDADRVFDVARTSGRFNADYLASLKSRKDKLYLVTYPGISTKKEVSDISGRGVGLDVVKSTLENFGGSFDIDSEPGRGTKITLFLPASISIINVLLFGIGKTVFGTPVDKIVRILEVPKKEVKAIDSEKNAAFWYSGQYIPLYYLGDLLRRQSAGYGDTVPLIITSIKGVLSAVAVDQFLGHKEVYLRPLNPPLSYIAGFYSSTIMGDGNPVLVIDFQGLA